MSTTQMIAIKPGQWRHTRSGQAYTVLGLGRLDIAEIEWSDQQCDIFRLEENPDLGVFLRSYRHGLFYRPLRANADYGDRVFYVGTSGRWARPPESFLLRFEQCPNT